MWNAHAATLSQLRDTLDAAINKFGPDRRWYGWEDEGILISDSNGYDVGRISNESISSEVVK